MLREHIVGALWLADYPIRMGGARFNARMTVLRRADGALIVHSPGPLDDAMRAQIDALGRVAVVLAPGNFHHLYVGAFQRAYPSAETWICPGVERKQPALRYDGILDGEAPRALAADLTIAPACLGRIMSEVPMLHRATRTLLLVDLIENIGDATPDINWVLRAWWKAIGMWNEARPAPEYRIGGWRDRGATRATLELVLSWDFERIVISHGELIERDAKELARRAWKRQLR